METGRKPLCRGKSCNHQPLELASGPHLGPGIPHPAADRHIQTDPGQQGRLLPVWVLLTVLVSFKWINGFRPWNLNDFDSCLHIEECLFLLLKEHHNSFFCLQQVVQNAFELLTAELLIFRRKHSFSVVCSFTSSCARNVVLLL